MSDYIEICKVCGRVVQGSRIDIFYRDNEIPVIRGPQREVCFVLCDFCAHHGRVLKNYDIFYPDGRQEHGRSKLTWEFVK